jgi:integrase/recombinase XerD
VNRDCNVTKRVQISKGQWRYCPVVYQPMAASSRMWSRSTGREERHLEGAYYLEWRDGGKRIRLSVGKDAADASARRQRKESELNALNNGVVVVQENCDNGHRSFDHWQPRLVGT